MCMIEHSNSRLKGSSASIVHAEHMYAGHLSRRENRKDNYVNLRSENELQKLRRVILHWTLCHKNERRSIS